MGKRVVVTGSKRGSKTAWLFLRFILRLYGAKPVFVHEKSRPPKDFDGLIISGGIDICPTTYGSQLPFRCNEARDRLELELLDRAVERDLPVLGICRGMQLINAYFGGTLHPEISDLDLDRPHPNSPFPVNEIIILPLTKLRAILQRDRIKANALHHQAVQRLGEDLRINAKDTNGIIQGIEHTTHCFLIGVQWHPEYLPYSPSHRQLFYALIREIC